MARSGFGQVLGDPVHSILTEDHPWWHVDVEKDEPRIYAFILQLLLINKSGLKFRFIIVIVAAGDNLE